MKQQELEVVCIYNDSAEETIDQIIQRALIAFIERELEYSGKTTV